MSDLLDTVRNHFNASAGSALVIGDLMLDRYLIGDVQRISPEAPVPVVLLKNQNERAGGAANVAMNLALLGIKTHIIGCVGQDAEALTLTALLNKHDIKTENVYASSFRPTITKTRILGGHQQMMRLDQESSQPFQPDESKAIENIIIEAIARKPSIVILSDYAKGLLSESACRLTIKLCQQANIPVLVDPKGKDYTKYTGATALTPNKREAAEACGVSQDHNDLLLLSAEILRNRLGLKYLAVTRGEEGISLIEHEKTSHLPATARQVFDVSGAGDTVISTLAAGLLAGLEFSEAIRLANIAAGIVVGKVGTVPITREELLHELISQKSHVQADKICDLEHLLLKVQSWRQLGQKIVFTNGCFDLLHAGHVTYLEAAKKAGDRLVLGLNTDRSVSALKGPSRPVIHEQDRARVLAALEAIDAVILFDEDTPIELIKAIKPDVLAKGSDYTEDQVVGGVEVKSWGGKVSLVDIVEGRSTSNIIKKLAS